METILQQAELSFCFLLIYLYCWHGGGQCCQYAAHTLFFCVWYFNMWLLATQSIVN